mgnify:CR=1 FL=1
MTILIERFGTPLKDWDIRINYGIKTGCNEAFIIDEKIRAKLIAEDPKSAEIIRPILRGKDIKKNSYEFAGLYVILAIFDSHKWMEQKYPAIYNHLSQYEDKLKKRGQCRYLSSGKIHHSSDHNYPGYPGMHHWLELDNNPRQKYMDDFNKQKICYSETNSSSLTKIALDKDGYMTDKTCFIITAADNFDIDILYKIMSSEIFTWYMNLLSPKLGDKGISLTKDTVKLFPASKRSENGVQESYSLTDEEMNFISSSVSKKN